MRTLRLAVVAVAAAAALTACGADDTSAPTPTPTPTTATAPVTEQPSSSAPATPPVGPSVTPTPGPTAGAPTPKPGGGQSLTGRITAGVEPGCLLLDNHLLIGGPRDVLAVGARVTVTGRVVEDMATTCQQGTPFVVETAKRS
ncbi:hypothetical protein ACFOOK_25835 [Micromonospora krabiensis]|uniref:Uncharacterized protein n=1 Tax=Micromonospora krabiensis TaxID=307121 RepID=A0A1C3N633_9ACTN|nr:hypothetical protein [Micromonospora krabiensis]SBV28013.1 hypothetical protein GA0070620_3545 [Micromonospora krabiensis]